MRSLTPNTNKSQTRIVSWSACKLLSDSPLIRRTRVSPRIAQLEKLTRTHTQTQKKKRFRGINERDDLAPGVPRTHRHSDERASQQAPKSRTRRDETRQGRAMARTGKPKAGTAPRRIERRPPRCVVTHNYVIPRQGGHTGTAELEVGMPLSRISPGPLAVFAMHHSERGGCFVVSYYFPHVLLPFPLPDSHKHTCTCTQAHISLPPARPGLPDLTEDPPLTQIPPTTAASPLPRAAPGSETLLICWWRRVCVCMCVRASLLVVLLACPFWRGGRKPGPL